MAVQVQKQLKVPGGTSGEGSVNHSREEDATLWSARPPSGKHQQNKSIRLPCLSKKHLPTAVALATYVLPETKTQPWPLGPRPPAPLYR